MSKFDPHWLSRFAAAVLFLLTTVARSTAPAQKAPPPPTSQTHNSSTSQARQRMLQAVEKTYDQGLLGKLPPHLSTLLGLSNEEECPVMQGVVRSGTTVQGFDVSMANKNDVIIFVVDQATNNQTLYLASNAGALRRIVTVEQGTGQVKKITPEDRKAFAKEKEFWLDKLAPLAAP